MNDGSLGFGPDLSHLQSSIKGIAFFSLSKYPSDLVVSVGTAVIEVVARFRLQNPDQVPTVAGSPDLLSNFNEIVRDPYNDFELARHLLETKHAEMNAVVKLAKGLPILLSYLSVLTISNPPPSPYLFKSALPFAIESLKFDVIKQEQWQQRLQTAIEKLTPLARTGQKFKGRKPGSYGPLAKAIRKHLEKYPRDKPRDIWDTFVLRPPKGMFFREVHKVGKYVEYVDKGAAFDTDYRQFQNRVSEQRASLYGTQKRLKTHVLTKT